METKRRMLPEANSLTHFSNYFHKEKYVRNNNRTESSLKNKHENLSTVLEYSSNAMCITDADGNIINFNNSFTKFHRLSNKLELPRSFYEFTDLFELKSQKGEDIPSKEHFIQKALKGIKGIKEPYLTHRKDLKERWNGIYNYGPIFNSIGDICGAFIEVTESPVKDSVTGKLKSEIIENFRELFKSSPEMACLTRISDFKIVAVNDNFIAQFCHHPEEVIGKSIDELNLWANLDHKKLYLDEALRNGSVSNYEAEFRRKDGTTFPGLISCKVFKFFGEDHILCFRRDISKIKETEDLLKESNDTKDKFFSIIAHDLRSPLNSIMGLMNILVGHAKETSVEEMEVFLNLMNTSAKNTLSLLDNLLNWARSQTGRLQFEPITVNINAAIREVICSLETSTLNKNIKLTFKELKEEMIIADPDMIKTILRNLISNAIKFTNQNGRIEIKIKRFDSLIQIAVSDNGIGMNDKTKNKLFNSKINDTTMGTENEKGTGLGLILCKDFVEKHGGHIWVESSPGKGSSFKFTLPAGHLSTL